jgi:trimeric autotransporter adhesin
MKQVLMVASVVLFWFACAFSHGQQVVATNTNAAVPPLINFSGTLTDASGKPLTGTITVTFSLYSEQTGGAALWMETQNVQLDSHGNYTVMLGSTSSIGLPADIFVAGQAHWLGVQVQGQEEQPRVLLVSAPYALKAGDAETIGGLPPSAFAPADPASSVHSANSKSNTKSPATETQSYIPVFIDASGDLGNSILYQSGTTEVGIGTTTPGATLEVNGTAKFDGLATFAPGQTFPGTLTGVTAGTGVTVSGSKTAPTININTTFANEYYPQLDAANTFTKSQTVNGTMTATSFSGSGSGLTNVNAAELGGVASSAFAQLSASSNTFTGGVTAASFTGSGSGLTSVNASQLGGLSSSTFAQLAAANTFTGNQTVSGNLSATGVVTGSSFNIGSNLFAFGSYANSNAFLGFAGNTTMTGTANTASGYDALVSNTSGSANTASGYYSLFSNTSGEQNTASGLYALANNTTGGNNTASGYQALFSNTTGDNNTASGLGALVFSKSCCNTASGYAALTYVTTGQANTGVGNNAGATADTSTITGANNTFLGTGTAMSTGSLTNATAIGANAEVEASNTLILGSINGVNGQTVTVNVGIGTTTPDNNLTVNGTADKPGGGSWGTYSDRRLKNLDGSFSTGLSQILKMNPVRYRYKEENAMGIRDTDEHVGLVAQEVQKVIPEAVSENSKGYLLVNNDPILWAMLNAIKEQQREITSLRAQLRKRAAKDALLESRLTQLEHDGTKVTRLASARPAH